MALRYINPKRKPIDLSHKLKNNTLQSSDYMDIRLKFMEAIVKYNPMFTITTNSAGVPMLNCPHGVLSCTVYNHDHFCHFIRLKGSDLVDDCYINVIKKSKQKHTYNKHTYIYNADIIHNVIHDTKKEFCEQLHWFPVDVASIVFDYL